MTAERRVPRLVPLPAGRTLQSFPLGPVDGFVLSRIDGSTSESELASFTGLDAAAIAGSLDKLASLGLVTFGALESGATPTRAPSDPVSIKAATIPPGPISESNRPPRPSTPDARLEESPGPRGLYDPSELDEDVDIERDVRRRTLDLFYRLDELDYYTLLGVGPGATKKAIKSAYYDAAGVFHPDRYFRKRLGSFKNKMEAVFGRMTLAHDTLTSDASRGEYDEYLGDRLGTIRLERELREAEVAPAPAPSPPPAPVTPAPSPPPPATSSSSPPIRRSTAPRIAISEQARRDAFARRLMGTQSTAPPPVQRHTTSIPAATQADADTLRRHYEARVGAVKDKLLREHVESAKQALAKDDPVAAVSFYRQALDIAGNDPELRAALDQTQALANKKLGDSYRRQAQYEEKSGRYPEASRSWARAAKCFPNDAVAHERAAYTALKGDGNLHEASQLAQRAVLLDGANAKFRVTLAQVYMAAGLSLNARRELEAALALAPGDNAIENLLKRVGKA